MLPGGRHGSGISIMNTARIYRFVVARICLLVVLFLPAGLRAGVQAIPRPGWPTADYKTVLASLNQTTFAVIYYYDGSKVIVADSQWLERLKQLLAAADGKPASYCFCINYPQIELLTKAGPFATMEVPHGNKLRFFGREFSGDFGVDPKIAKAILDLAMEQRTNAVPGVGKAKPKTGGQ